MFFKASGCSWWAGRHSLTDRWITEKLNKKAEHQLTIVGERKKIPHPLKLRHHQTKTAIGTIKGWIILNKDQWNEQLLPEININKTTDPEHVSYLCCWYINSNIFFKKIYICCKDINLEEENECALL